MTQVPRVAPPQHPKEQPPMVARAKVYISEHQGEELSLRQVAGQR